MVAKQEMADGQGPADAETRARQVPYAERRRRLHAACAAGDDDAARACLGDGAAHSLAAEQFGDACETALHAAARGGAVGAAEALLEAGADVDACDTNSHTPAHVASVHGRAGVLDVLLRAGPGRHVTGCLAAAAGAVLSPSSVEDYDKCTEMLLRYMDLPRGLAVLGARRPDDADRARCAPLPSAPTAVRRELEYRAAVHNAARHGRAKALSAMVAAGLPLFVVRDGPGTTVLHLAAASGSDATVAAALAALTDHAARHAGARTFTRELEWKDAEGRSPLAHALAARADAAAHRLVRAGASPTSCGASGAPAWSLAPAPYAVAHARGSAVLDDPTAAPAAPYAARRRRALAPV